MNSMIPRKWTLEKLQEEALKFKNKKDFFKKSRGAYSTASNGKVLDIICAHMPEVSNKAWTHKELKEEALKYNTRFEFQKNSNSAWQIARNRKILDEICAHMPNRIDQSGEKHPRFKWTLGKLQIEALKYNSRSVFSEKSRGAYKSALNRNLLDEICKHMDVAGPTSIAEQDLFGVIKELFPKAQTLRIRSKRTESLIEGKFHIQGFDIDIYVPELRKGIELNGTYWHSIPGLKRSRMDWPVEDLINYHKIKDSYFLSKGIRILHIKEEDWIADKQTCIDRSLEFLGVERKKVA